MITKQPAQTALTSFTNCTSNQLCDETPTRVNSNPPSCNDSHQQHRLRELTETDDSQRSERKQASAILVVYSRASPGMIPSLFLLGTVNPGFHLSVSLSSPTSVVKLTTKISTGSDLYLHQSRSITLSLIPSLYRNQHHSFSLVLFL